MQYEEGQALAGTPRPKYEIPNEVLQATTIARQNYADTVMPGQSFMEGQNNLAAQNAIQALQVSGAPISAVAGIQAQQSKNAQEIGIQAANWQRQDETAYQQALGMLADQKAQQWQVNEFAPYSQAYAEGRQMMGAGMENMYGAFDSLANMAMASSYANETVDTAKLGKEATNSANQTIGLNTQYEKALGDISKYTMMYTPTTDPMKYTPMYTPVYQPEPAYNSGIDPNTFNIFQNYK